MWGWELLLHRNGNGGRIGSLARVRLPSRKVQMGLNLLNNVPVDGRVVGWLRSCGLWPLGLLGELRGFAVCRLTGI